MRNNPGNSHFKKQSVLLPSGHSLSYYDTLGGNHCLLFVHGLAGMADVWMMQLKALSKNYRCIALDLPGCGSSDPLQHYSMKAYCHILTEFITTLELKNFIPVGHSMGGQIVIHWALTEPRLFKKIILLAPAGFEKFSPIEIDVLSHLTGLGGMFLAHENQFGNFLRQSFFKYEKPAVDLVNDFLEKLHQCDKVQWRKMVAQSIKMMLTEPTLNRLNGLTQQVLVIFGEKDLMIPNIYLHPVTTKHLAELACSRIVNCHLSMIKMAGHFVFFEKHQETNHIISQFVENTVKPGC